MNTLSLTEKEILPLLSPLRKHLESTLSPTLLAKISVDDIIQDTYIRAVSSFSSAEFQNDNMLFGWLKRIATNVAISFIRKKDANTSLFANSSSDIAQQLLETGELTPSGMVSANENKQLLALAILKLTEKHQEIIRLRYHDRMAFEDIASLIGTTSGAVRGLHRNALEKLRDILGDMAKFLSSR